MSPMAFMISLEGPMKTMPFFLTGIHKVGILGKKAVSGMDGVYVRRKGDPDDGVDIQVGVDGTLVRIQRIRFICFGMEERIFVFLGKNADGLDPQFVQGTEYADRDLAPVCDQYLSEWFDLYVSAHNVPPFC